MKSLKFEICEHPTDSSMLEFYLADRDKKWLVQVINADQWDGMGELGIKSKDLPATGFFIMDTEYEFQCPRCDYDMSK